MPAHLKTHYEAGIQVSSKVSVRAAWQASVSGGPSQPWSCLGSVDLISPGLVSGPSQSHRHESVVRVLSSKRGQVAAHSESRRPSQPPSLMTSSCLGSPGSVRASGLSWVTVTGRSSQSRSQACRVSPAGYSEPSGPGLVSGLFSGSPGRALSVTNLG